MTRSFTAAALAALLLSTSAVAAHAAMAVPRAIAMAVADAGRPDADKMRDATRKPAEVLAFAGVKPGMVVAELGSGGGYYTRILAKAVGPKGKVLAVVTKGQAARPGGLDGINAIAAAYPNVTVVTVDTLPTLALPEKADLFWTTENYHDFHNNGGAPNIPAMDKAIFDNLKAGGTFYVEDHSAAPGGGLEAGAKLHRMDEALAKTELMAAGFRLDAEGDLLHNASDNRAASNSEAGHFVTDRFMLRLKK
jgi:predicted methyltransferase